MDNYLIDLLRLSGDLALNSYSSNLNVEYKKLGTGVHLADPVSVADQAVENFLVDELSKTFPDDGIIGEENTSKVSTSGRAWIIDPIDGTAAFLGQRSNGWAIVIALIEGDITLDEDVVDNAGKKFPGPDKYQTKLAIIYQPADNLFCLANPEGSFLIKETGLESLSTSTKKDLKSALFATYLSAKQSDYQTEINKILMNTTATFNCSGGSTEQVRVASGLLEGWMMGFPDNATPWDYIAGEYIVKQAGGVSERFADFICLAANQSIADQVKRLVSSK